MAVVVVDLVLRPQVAAAAQHSILAQVALVQLAVLAVLILAVVVDQVQLVAPQVSAEAALLLFDTHHKIKD